MVEEHTEPRIHTFGSKRREQMVHTFGSRQHSKETDGTFIEELFNSEKADRNIVVPLVLLIVGLVLICLIFFKWRTWRDLGHQTLKEIKVTTSTTANDVKLESEGEGSSLSAHLTKDESISVDSSEDSTEKVATRKKAQITDAEEVKKDLEDPNTTNQ